MPLQLINIGSAANDRTGDPLRTAFTKVNSMLTELYGIEASYHIIPAEHVLTVLNTTEATAENVGAMNVLGGATIAKSLNVGDSLHVGPGADNNTYVSPVFVGQRGGSAYVQGIIINTDGHGSADWVAQADNGSEEQGWIDMGMSGSVFDDPDYTITDAGDGYIFVQGVDDGISHGELVLCTGEFGIHKDIVFGTGGFLRENTRMTLDHGLQSLVVDMTTPSTAPTNGAITVAGGVGIQGALYTGNKTVLSSVTKTAVNGGAATALTVTNSPNTNWTNGTGVFANGINFTVAVNAGVATVTTINDGGSGHYVGETFGPVPGSAFGGTDGVDDMNFEVTAVTADVTQAIDLTKTINKLTPLTGGSGGQYTLADGVEGQIMYLVPAGAIASNEDTTITFSHARWTNGSGVITEQANASWWLPFNAAPNTSSIIVTLIFTDGHWNLPHSYFD